MVTITLNGKTVEAEEGLSILRVARDAGVDIPALCFHPALKPFGACKLCAVETVSVTGAPLVMLACILKVKEGLVVHTETERVRAAREKAMQKLLEQAPDAARLQALARRYGLSTEVQPLEGRDDCVRCGLCIRVCKERIGQAALQFVKRGEEKFVAPVAEGRCIGCGACAALCPTGVIRFEEKDGRRTVRKGEDVFGEFVLVRCEVCGRPFTTGPSLDKVAERLGDSFPAVRRSLCEGCARARFAGDIPISLAKP